MNEIILFEDQNVKLEVNMKDETVWLTQGQMAELFDKSKSTINEHIKNIYNCGELVEIETMTKFGNSEFSDKPVYYYNLDVIISVGYRVKSKQGIIFRRWANQVLKDYLLKGYAVNNKRLEFLEKKVKLIDIASRIESGVNVEEVLDIIKVISNYKEALKLLDDYDYKNINRPCGTFNCDKITYLECISVINKLNFNSSLFGIERNNGLEEILGSVYQTFDGCDLYKSIEEKAANFLYLIIKNHVFIDGNKRIGAVLFIYFLNYYNLLYRDDRVIIDNNTLVAITLLIAESNPREKDILVDLIMNFLI